MVVLIRFCLDSMTERLARRQASPASVMRRDDYLKLGHFIFEQ